MRKEIPAPGLPERVDAAAGAAEGVVPRDIPGQGLVGCNFLPFTNHV